MAEEQLARTRIYSDREEQANTISHAIGILLGLGTGGLLLSKAFDRGGWAVASVIVYLCGMLSCYIISTCYHGCREGKRKRLLQKWDHALIYVHIAGTYTPFTLVTLREVGWWGWSLFSFVWLSAIIGVFVSFRRHQKHSYLETACYVIMGCSVLVAFKPLIDVLGQAGHLSALYWLIGGGISYIIGAVFYSLTKKQYMHTVFHFFVLGGSICHIIAIYMVL